MKKLSLFYLNMKKFVILATLLVALDSQAQGTRLQPGGVPTPVPVYNISQIVSNVLAVLGTNSGIGYQSQAGDSTIIILTNGTTHVYTLRVQTNKYDLAGTAQTLVNALGQSQNVLTLGCLGGTNDDTATLQGIISGGGQFYFPPTNYTLGALNITNNTTWVGPGAVLNFKTNLTSTTMININSNVQNVLFDGLTFNGGNTNNAYTSNRGTNNLRIFARPCCNADVHFRDLRIYGFDIGVYPYGKPGAGSFTVQQQPRFDMQFCELATNGVGILCWTLDANAVVEYLTFNNLILHDNSYGFWINAGNINVANSIVSFNRVGFQLDGHSGINSGHGLIIGNTVNHSGLYPVICDTLATGYTIQNNKFLAGGTIQLWDSIKVVITGNHFDVDGNVFSGDGGGHGSKGPNYVVNNDFVGVWGVNNGGLLVYDYTAGTDSTTNLQNWLNYSTSAFGADDPHHWNPFTTNSFVEFTTNPPPARAFVQSGAYLWNSNGVGMYIVLSSATGTNWTSTNAIPGAGGSSSVVLPPNARGLLSNDGSGTTNWYAYTNIVVWTNQPSFVVGQYLQITGTNANGSLVVNAVTAPAASNYMAVINTPNLSNGMIAVFTGTTNSDGAPQFKGTNPPTGGSLSPWTSDIDGANFALYRVNDITISNATLGASSANLSTLNLNGTSFLSVLGKTNGINSLSGVQANQVNAIGGGSGGSNIFGGQTIITNLSLCTTGAPPSDVVNPKWWNVITNPVTGAMGKFPIYQ